MPLSHILPKNEKMLLKQAAEGDERAFEQLFHAFRDRLYGFIFRVTDSKEIAEDILQDVFLKIWIHREKLTAVDNFNAYLFRMSQNHAINHLRRLSKETLVLLETRQRNDVQNPAADEQLVCKNMQQLVKEIVDGLPSQQKAVYLLSREQNLKQEEIARRLHISISTVKNHMTHALHTIRERLGRYYPTVIIAGFLALTIPL